MGRIQGLIIFVFALLCSCHESALNVAIKTANGASEVGETAADVLRDTCTDAYSELASSIETKRMTAVEGTARLEKLDTYCPKMRDAYRALRAAHIALLAGVKAAQAGALSIPVLIPLTTKTAEAMAVVSRIGAEP